MKEGWEYKKLGEIYDVRDGTHDSPKYQDSGYPLVTSKNLKSGILDMSNVNYISESDYLSINQRSKVDIGDVLFAMIGTIGNPVYVYEEPKYAIKNMALFKVPCNQSGKFLRYFLLNGNTLLKMQRESKGTTQKFVSLNYLRNFKIHVPPFSEQQSIVDYLDSAFAKIDAMKANAEKALNEAKALFQASLKEMLEPKEGWEEKKFGKICEFVRGPFGGSLKKECFRDSGYAVYEQQNAIYNKFTFRYFIDEEKYKSLIRFKVNSGDLIMSCSGTIGKVAIIPEDCIKGIINQALLKLTPKKEIDAHFLKYLMESKYFGEIINANIEGVAIKNIASVAVLKEITLYIPEVGVQQSIVDNLDSLKSKVDRLQENYEKISQECDALKQAILRQVFE